MANRELVSALFAIRYSLFAIRHSPFAHFKATGPGATGPAAAGPGCGPQLTDAGPHCEPEMRPVNDVVLGDAGVEQAERALAPRGHRRGRRDDEPLQREAIGIRALR